MDDIDRLLLDEVQRDASRPLHVLGDAVGLSPSAVQRRLTRLRADGVIRAEVAVVDPRSAGPWLTAIVLVALRSDDEAEHAAFRDRMRAESGVQQCYAIVGQWDYVLVVLSPDLAANRTLSARLFGSDGTVQRYETLPAYDAIKLGLELPLGPP